MGPDPLVAKYVMMSSKRQWSDETLLRVSVHSPVIWRVIVRAKLPIIRPGATAAVSFAIKAVNKNIPIWTCIMNVRDSFVLQ